MICSVQLKDGSEALHLNTVPDVLSLLHETCKYLLTAFGAPAIILNKSSVKNIFKVLVAITGDKNIHIYF